MSYYPLVDCIVEQLLRVVLFDGPKNCDEEVPVQLRCLTGRSWQKALYHFVGQDIAAQIINAKLWVPGEFTLIGNLHGDEVFLASENVL